jgi:hypothetical protein
MLWAENTENHHGRNNNNFRKRHKRNLKKRIEINMQSLSSSNITSLRLSPAILHSRFSPSASWVKKIANGKNLKLKEVSATPTLS